MNFNNRAFLEKIAVRSLDYSYISHLNDAGKKVVLFTNKLYCI